MRAVLDTNVVVSGVLSADSTCGRILDLILEGIVEVCADRRILAEYRDVCLRPELALDGDEVRRVLAFLEHQAYLVRPSPLRASLPDPDDLPFLEAAASAGVPLVTGNRRHFPKHACGSVNVLSPREFLDVLREAP